MLTMKKDDSKIRAFLMLVTMATTLDLSVQACSHGRNETPEMRARYYFGQLKDAVMEMDLLGTRGGYEILMSILTKDNNNSNNSNDSDNDNHPDLAVSKLVFKALSSTICHSVCNIPSGSSINVNIYNSTVNISPQTKISRDENVEEGKDGNKAERMNGGGGVGGGKRRDEDYKETLTESSEFQILSRANSTENSQQQHEFWQRDIVHPLKVKAKREGQMVRMTFTVARTDTATVSHSWTYNGRTVLMKGPSDYGIDNTTVISSDVDFRYNASEFCLLEDPNSNHGLSTKREEFVFSQDNNDTFSISISIPTCLFEVLSLGKDNNNNDNNNNRNMAEAGGKRMNVAGGMGENNEDDNDDLSLTQTLHYPEFWNQIDVTQLTTQPSSRSELRSNLTLRFDIALTAGRGGDTFMINGFFYDPETDALFYSNMLFLSATDNKISVSGSPSGSKMVSVLNCEVENETLVNTSVPGLKSMKRGGATTSHVSARVKVIISLPNDKVSGHLFLQNSVDVLVEDTRERLVYEIRVGKLIRVLPWKQKHALPEGRFLENSMKRISCKDDGSRFFNFGFGKNCVIFCQVIGRGIRNVTIKRTRGGVVPIEQFTEVNSNSGYAIANLGPARRAVEGEYQCRAVGYRGKSLMWEVKVRSWGFPIVTNSSLTISGQSAIFVCAGNTSRLPVHVNVSLHSSDKEIQDLVKRPNVVSNGSETKLILEMPSSYLKYPTTFIECRVTNMAGEDTRFEMVSTFNFPDYYYGTDHPYLVQDQSHLTYNKTHGIATVKCVATGKQPMTMDFYIDSMAEDGLINQNDSSSSVISRTEKSHEVNGTTFTTFTLTLPTSDLTCPASRLYCVARNVLGKASMELDLDNDSDSDSPLTPLIL